MLFLWFVDIFVQLCHILRQAGHTERAISLFQAAVELNLNYPPSLSTMKLKERLEFLEAFWDSGAPRVGEEGARGWSYWIDHKDEEQGTKPLRTKGKIISLHYIYNFISLAPKTIYKENA